MVDKAIFCSLKWGRVSVQVCEAVHHKRIGVNEPPFIRYLINIDRFR